MGILEYWNMGMIEMLLGILVEWVSLEGLDQLAVIGVA